jgi:hypothetical protein
MELGLQRNHMLGQHRRGAISTILTVLPNPFGVSTLAKAFAEDHDRHA